MDVWDSAARQLKASKGIDEGYKRNSSVRPWREYMGTRTDVRTSQGLIQQRQENQSG